MNAQELNIEQPAELTAYPRRAGRIGPANNNYIDGAWEMWCVACDRVIPTRPDCADLHIPGAASRAGGRAG